MEVVYSKNDLRELIKKYYLEKGGRNVEVSISSKSELIGFYGTNTCVTTINIKETINLLGKDAIVSKTLTKEELYDMLSVMLEDSGYILGNLEYDEGIKQVCVGYFMNEHMECKPYFNGVIMNVRKNSLIKK